jgi:hypothetical protein
MLIIASKAVGQAPQVAKKPLILLATGGVAQNFLTISTDAIESADGKISPLFSLSVFQYKPGLTFQTGLGINQHRFGVKTISSDHRSLELINLDVPLLARYNFSPAMSMSGGVSMAFNLSTKADFDFETGRPEQGTKTKHDTVKNSISNVRLCANYFFPFGLNIQVTYTHALTEIFEDGVNGKPFGFMDIQIGYPISGYRANDRLRTSGPVNGWP